MLSDAPQRLVQQGKVAKIPIVSGKSSNLLGNVFELFLHRRLRR